MAIGLDYDPNPATAGEEVTLEITNYNGDPEFARFELVGVPDQSELETGMLVDAAGDYIKTFTPDVGGLYEFIGYDVRAYRGLSTHANDANGGERQIIIAQTSRGNVYVSTPVDIPIETTVGHNITLRLGVSGSAIQSSELVNPTTDLARLAALDTTVLGEVEDLVGVAVSDLFPTLTARSAALRTAYEAHRVLTAGAVHASADNTNVVDVETPTSDESALKCIQDNYVRLLRHLMAGASGGTWHSADDTKNLPLTPIPSTKLQAHIVACDLEERVYERHRVQTANPASHGAADNTNTLGAPSALTEFVVAYLDFIASNLTGTIGGENSSLLLMERKIGAMPTVV